MKNFTKIKLFCLLLFSVIGMPEMSAQVAATCTPTYSSGCGVGDDIDDVTFVGQSVTLSNLNTACPSGGYQDYTTSTSLGIPDMLPGQSYSGTVTTNYTGLYEYFKIWVDFNDNGTFEVTEEIASGGPINNASTGAFTTSVIPLGSPPGMKRMRVVLNYASSPSGPCGSFTWGETHDYKVQVLSLVPCTNPPVAGTATISPNTQSCPGFPTTLSLSGIVMGSGQTYEWESSPNNTTYTSLGPASLSPSMTVSPLVSTWYRCKVICSGGTPAYSTPVQILVAPGLSGTYTINSASPTGGTNFNNFTDAATALNCGIVAPVTINVVAGSGPYNETFNLNAIGGASATNKVRINGNGETIQFNATSTTNHRIVSLNNTKYLTINNLKIKSLSTTYGWGIHITGSAQNDSIINCEVNLSTITGTSSANANGIVVSGSTTSATAATANVSNIYILNNTVIAGGTGSGGGYYGIVFVGTSSANRSPNIFINNNEVTNFYYYGVDIWYAKTGSISNNNIHRPNKTAITTCYALRAYYNDSMLINANKIHNLAASGTTSTSSLYGLYVYYTNNSVISNNAIYNMNNYIASQYLLYSYYSNLCKIYHNTISTDAVQSANTGIMYHYYIYYNANTEVKNNILNATGGNTGTKYGMYVTPANATYPVTLAKNNIYMNSSQTGTQTPYYWATAYASLAAFQAAQPTQEVGSPSANPLFTNIATADLSPTNGALIGTGANVYADVPQDINGLPRSPAPTIGAYEIAPQGINNARMFSILKPTGNVCSGTQPVEVVVGNAGTNNITNMQINWTLNGVVQTPISYATPGYPTLVPVTTPGGQFSDTVSLGNATLVTGTNVIRVWTSSPNGQVDPYPSNDTAQISITPSVFALDLSQDTICHGGSASMTLTPGTGYTANSLQWEVSTNGGTTWTTAATNATTNYVEPNLVASKSYRVKILTGGANCYSNAETVHIFNITNPIAPASVERCGPGPITLTASTGPTGGTLKWYDAPLGGALLGTGPSFTTPSLTATTDYYVANGSGTGGNDSIAVPLANGNTTGVYHHMFLVTATTGMTINEIALKINDAVGTTNGWSVYYRPDNYQTVAGANTSATGWTLLSNNATVVSAGPSTYTTIASNVTLNIPAGSTYSLYIAPNGAGTHQYATPAAGTVSATTTTATILGGHRGSSLFNCTTSGGQAVVKLKSSSGCESARIPVSAIVRDVPVIDLGTDLDTCTFAAIPMTLDPGTQPTGTNYLWDDASTGATRFVNATGNYYVTVTNQYGCVATDTINILMREKPAIDLSTNGTSFCVGATKILDAGPGGQNGGTYYWNTGEQTQSIVVNSGGTYIVFVTSGDGCVNSDTINVAENGYAPSIDGILSYATGASQFNFAASNPQHIVGYEWDFGDGTPVSTAATPTHVYGNNGYFMVILKSNSVCADRYDTTYINIVGVGINDVDELSNNINVYPNPNSAQSLFINSKESIKIQKIVVTNILGQEVYINAAPKAQNGTYQIELPSNLSNGIYSVKLETEKGIATKKLEILR